MINLHERMLPTSAGVESGTSWPPIRRVFNWATEAGTLKSTCTHSFARKRQLPLLNHRKGENGHGKYFIVHLYDRMLLDPARIQSTTGPARIQSTTWSPDIHASVWSIEAGTRDINSTARFDKNFQNIGSCMPRLVGVVFNPFILSFWSGLLHSWIWTCPLMQIVISV